MHLEEKKCLQGFDGETQRKTLLGRSRRIWEDNIKMGFKRMVCENLEWIPLIQDKEKCQAVVKAFMDLRSSGNTGNFLII